MTTDTIDIVPFTKENSYKKVLEDKLKNLIFPEPYFKLHLTEYAKNIRPADANWDINERDKYTRYLKVWKKEIRTEKYQQSLAEVRAARNDKLITYIKECYKSAKTKLSDMQILVENKIFEVHRLMIACFIPFIFYRLSKVAEKELQGKESLKIKLKGVKAEAMEQIINYIYTGEVNPTEDNIFLVLETANRCFMNEFSDIWIIAFESKLQSMCLQLLFRCRVARHYGWKDYIVILNKSLALHFETLMLAEQFLNLTVEELCDILQHNEIGVKNEVIVFLAVLKWLNHDWKNRQKHAVEVMKEVRFYEMDNEELAACLNPPILKEALEISEVKAMIAEALKNIQERKDKQTGIGRMTKRIYHNENGTELILWTGETSSPVKHMKSKEEKPKEAFVEKPVLIPKRQPISFIPSPESRKQDVGFESATKQYKSWAYLDSPRSSACKCHSNHKNIEECKKAAAVKIQSFYRGYRSRKSMDLRKKKSKAHEKMKLETTPELSIKVRSKPGSPQSVYNSSSSLSKAKLRYDCYNS